MKSQRGGALSIVGGIAALLSIPLALFLSATVFGEQNLSDIFLNLSSLAGIVANVVLGYLLVIYGRNFLFGRGTSMASTLTILFGLSSIALSMAFIGGIFGTIGGILGSIGGILGSIGGILCITGNWQEYKTEMGPTVKESSFMISRIKKSPLSIVGVAILVFFIAVGLLAPVLAPPTGWDPYIIPREGYAFEPKPPSDKHPFGTTEGQYDLYYGVIWGTRSAFRVGFQVVGASLLIGLFIGCVAGYYGGIIDELMMRFTDIIFAFPGLILAMALVVALGQSLDSVMLALVLVGWPSYTRLIRGEIVRIKEEDFVEAAKAVGCSDLRVMVRHILPNTIYPIVIMASLDIGAIVLYAAALSFLGLGAPSGYADWGQIIARSRNWIVPNPTNPFMYWHTFMIPGIFIFTFVLGWNLLGDAFRDILDPTLRRR